MQRTTIQSFTECIVGELNKNIMVSSCFWWFGI